MGKGQELFFRVNSPPAFLTAENGDGGEAEKGSLFQWHKEFMESVAQRLQRKKHYHNSQSSSQSPRRPSRQSSQSQPQP